MSKSSKASVTYQTIGNIFFSCIEHGIICNTHTRTHTHTHTHTHKLYSMLTEALPSHQHQCALSMDEMKIKSGLVFSKHTGSLVGFTDLESVNHDIEKVIDGEHEDVTSGDLASHVFVLMARAVFQPSLCVPVAHYFSSNLKGLDIISMCFCSCCACERITSMRVNVCVVHMLYLKTAMR